MKRKDKWNSGPSDFFDTHTETPEETGEERRRSGLFGKPAGYGILALLLAEFVLLAVLLVLAGRAGIAEEGSLGLRRILNSAGIGTVGNYEKLCADESGFSPAERFLSHYLAEESTVISLLSPSFVSFVQHEYNVKYYAVAGETLLSPTGNPSGGGTGTGTGPAPSLPGQTTALPTGSAPSETAPLTDAPSAATPSAATTIPESTPPAQEDGYKYYQFDLGADGYSTTLYEGTGAVSVGILNDRSGSFDFSVSAESDRDLVYGPLTIQNPYRAEGFDLKDVLSTPLRIRATRDPDNPSVILYYTHTSEGYCLNADEKLLENAASLASYDSARNVVGCGNLIEQELTARQVGVLNCRDVNDETYDGAYGMSGALVKRVAERNPSAELAIDIHSNSLEYPKGTRYGPKAESGGQDYARILFVITAGSANPNWRENLKLSMLIIEKMEQQVPGISMGISLRNDAKYNSVCTEKGLLVEIGFEGNLVTEANATAKLLGEVLGEIYG